MGALRVRAGAVVVFGLAALVPLATRDAFFLDSLILIVMWGALSAAWNVAGGYAGQVSLGHAAFFGVGAYSAALVGVRYGLSPWLGLLLGVALSIVAGGLIGYLSNRLKGPYFALSTIAFSQVLLIVVSRWRGFTAGSEDATLVITKPGGGRFNLTTTAPSGATANVSDVTAATKSVVASGGVTKPAIEAVFTTCAASACAIMRGTNARQPWTAPQRFTARTRCHRRKGTSQTAPYSAMPALLQRRWTRPNRA